MIDCSFRKTILQMTPWDGGVCEIKICTLDTEYPCIFASQGYGRHPGRNEESICSWAPIVRCLDMRKDGKIYVYEK